MPQAPSLGKGPQDRQGESPISFDGRHDRRARQSPSAVVSVGYDAFLMQS
jgi:hypothetical protein